MKSIFKSLNIDVVFISSRLRLSTIASWESLFDSPRILDSKDCYASQVIPEKHYLRESHGTTGLHVLDLINRGSLKPGRSLYNRLLKICTDSRSLRHGMIVHAHVSRSEFKSDVALNNTLVNMYAKSGYLVDARRVFDEMPVRDVVSWTAMIAGYSQNHQPEEALALLRPMLRRGSQPNQYTLSSLVKACGESARETRRQTQIHAYGLKLGYESDVFVGSSLVDMYARTGMVSEARRVFDGAKASRNEVSWNALISAHAKRAEAEAALGMFRNMVREGHRATQFTYSSLCTAFARSRGSRHRAEWLHARIVKSGPRLISFVAKTLLETYANSNSVPEAEKIFARLARPDDDVAPWNAMLGAYARLGLAEKSAEMFDEMIGSDKVGIIEPDKETFLYLLEACNNNNDGNTKKLVERARRIFDSMKEEHGLEPGVGHYAAMVELLGRAGLEDEARELLARSSSEEVGSRARALARANESERACSWVEIGKRVHVFLPRDHRDMDDEIRERLSGKIGCDRGAIRVHFFEPRDGKDLREHSEKLATAFALLKTPLGSAMKVKKMSQ